VWGNDTCQFLVESAEFDAWEQFGDSDCYWIGATQETETVQRELQLVRERFERYNAILGHHYSREIAALALTLALSLLLVDLTARSAAPVRVAWIACAVLGCAALSRARQLREQIRRVYVVGERA
jgi:hypothetical protein